MASFDLWIDGLLKSEGGYASTDNDRGAVNRGITQLTLDGIHSGHPNVAYTLGLPMKVADLTVDHTKGIYRAMYWDAMNLDQISNQPVANLLGHMGVNQGTHTAVVFLQKALSDFGAGLTVDGKLGPKTAAAEYLTAGNPLCKVIKFYALSRYVDLAMKNPALYLDDLKGWKARLDSL